MRNISVMERGQAALSSCATRTRSYHISAENFAHANLNQRDKDYYGRIVPAIQMGYTVKLCSSFWQATRNGEGRRQ